MTVELYHAHCMKYARSLSHTSKATRFALPESNEMNVYASQDDCISKLGKRMQNLRSDRPDEWTMDDFIREADDMHLKMTAMRILILDLHATLRVIQKSSNSMIEQSEIDRKHLGI